MHSLSLSQIARACLAACLLASAIPALAASEDRSERGHRGPPPQAFEACANQSEAAECVFEGRRGDVTGVCRIGRDEQEQLVCAPTHRPRGRGRQEEGEQDQPS